MYTDSILELFNIYLVLKSQRKVVPIHICQFILSHYSLLASEIKRLSYQYTQAKTIQRETLNYKKCNRNEVK